MVAPDGKRMIGSSFVVQLGASGFYSYIIGQLQNSLYFSLLQDFFMFLYG